MIHSDNTQKMTVEVSFEYEADVFEGENDMYALANDELEYLKKEILATLELSSLSGFQIKVEPELI